MRWFLCRPRGSPFCIYNPRSKSFMAKRRSFEMNSFSTSI